ncbi:hypothetical protein ABOM_009903 [Aspergillus bombycis]|uniref:Small secreted protein n=1 Tax=Aspergillus bombycis TaxID=109264 RepID=A0A1F7ZQI9_9EURO|nr:hypothetical protein ABOM_009903 [Aspergillus bombycis]OGM41702.1 hypothetical protein ABOM_009903 [Aspergillus bombycis]
MRFTAAVLMLATAIGGATAAPSAEAAHLQARDEPVNIQVCTGINKAGCTGFTVYTQHQCFNLHGTPVDQNVHSVSIPDGYRCRFWSSTVCNGGGTGDIQAPGNDNIGSSGVSSVKCYKN